MVNSISKCKFTKFFVNDFIRSEKNDEFVELTLIYNAPQKFMSNFLGAVQRNQDSFLIVLASALSRFRYA